MPFIQIIELTTDRIEECEALVEEWERGTAGRRTAQRGTLTQDRDRPGTYLQIVEFPSHEAAMANSALPETAKLALALAERATAPVTFRNLDVVSVREMA
jgi:hypothetical protein